MDIRCLSHSLCSYSPSRRKLRSQRPLKNKSPLSSDSLHRRLIQHKSSQSQKRPHMTAKSLTRSVKLQLSRNKDRPRSHNLRANSQDLRMRGTRVSRNKALHRAHQPRLQSNKSNLRLRFLEQQAHSLRPSLLLQSRSLSPRLKLSSLSKAQQDRERRQLKTRTQRFYLPKARRCQHHCQL